MAQEVTVLARIISKLTYTYKPHISISTRDWDLAMHQDKVFPIFYSSVQFSCSVVSNSLQPHGLQHARPPCPSSTPRNCSNSCPSREKPSNHLILCHPLLLPPSIFPSIMVFTSESVFTSGSQSIGVSASASVLPMNIQD